MLAAQTTACGAERKHVTLPVDFRLPRGNGHSRYRHPTARFALSRHSRRAEDGGVISTKPHLPGPLDWAWTERSADATQTSNARIARLSISAPMFIII